MPQDEQNNFTIPWKDLSLNQIISGISDITLHWIMRALPIDVCSHIGGTLGKLLGPRHKDADSRLRNNIRFLKPHLSTTELEITVKKWWENHGRVLAEFSVLRRLWKSNRTSMVGSEHINHAKQTSRPIIFLLLHTGNWEITGPKLAALFVKHPIHIYQEIDNYFKMKIANNIRAPYANHLIKPHFSAGRKIYKKLISGHPLIIAVDEHVNGKLNGPSFGRDLSTSGNVVFALRLAKLTNAILLPVYTTRNNGANFTVTILPAMELDFENFNDADLKSAQIKIDEITDHIIRQNVDQWYYATSNGLFENA